MSTLADRLAQANPTQPIVEQPIVEQPVITPPVQNQPVRQPVQNQPVRQPVQPVVSTGGDTEMVIEPSNTVPGDTPAPGVTQGGSNRIFHDTPISATARQRTAQIPDTLRSRDVTKTPAMQRTEHFTRMADRLNNRQYWRPGAIFAAAGQAMQGPQGEAYQQPKMEFEDQREQLINRARHGDKLAYQELGRVQAIDSIVFKIQEGEQLNINDLEKLRAANNEMLRQRLNIDEAALEADLRRIDERVQYKQLFEAFSAELEMDAEKAVYFLTLMGDNPRAGMVIGQMMGIEDPTVWKEIMGVVSEWARDSEASAAAARAASQTVARTGGRGQRGTQGGRRQF